MNIKKRGSLLSRPFFKERAFLFALLVISGCIILWDYIFGEKLMVFNDIGSDTMQQYIMQYNSIVRNLKAGTFSFWDFTDGMGVNIMGRNLFDPSLMLTYALGVVFGTDRMLYFLAPVHLLRITAAGMLFHYFISYFSPVPGAADGSGSSGSPLFVRHADTRIGASLCYALSGYLLVWGQHYQFGMAVVYLPLLLAGAERYIRSRRGGLLSLTVFLSAIYSVYFSFMSFLFLGIYIFMRILVEEGSAKQRAVRFFGGCGRILLGLLMSMVIFLPMALNMVKGSGRVGQMGFEYLFGRGLGHFSLNYYESVLLRFFSTNLQTTASLRDEFFETAFNYYEDPILFASVIVVFLNVQLLIRYRRERRPRRVKIVVYTAMALVIFAIAAPFAGILFNVMSAYSARFTYVLVPVLILGASYMWERIREGDGINIALLAVSAAAMLFACGVGLGQSIFFEQRLNAVLLAVSGTATAFVIWLIASRAANREEMVRGVSEDAASEKSEVRIPRGMLAALLVCLLFYLVSEGRSAYEARVTLRKSDTPAEKIEEEWNEYYEANASNDPEAFASAPFYVPQGFFRAKGDPELMAALAYIRESDPEFVRVEKDFISLTNFTDALTQGYCGLSTYNSVLNSGVVDYLREYYPELKDPIPVSYTFSGKSETARAAAFLGVRYVLARAELPEDKYELVNTFGQVMVYRNRYPASVARFIGGAVSEDEAEGEGLTYDAIYNMLEKNVILAEAESTVGEAAGTAESRAGSASGASAVESAAEIPAGVGDPSGESSAPVTSGSGDQSTGTEPSAKIFRGRTDSELTGEVVAPTDGYLLLTIPCEDGWSFTVDGQRAEALRADLGFFALKIKAGSHSFTASFTPPGLKTGAILSLVGWGIFILLSFLRRRSRER